MMKKQMKKLKIKAKLQGNNKLTKAPIILMVEKIFSKFLEDLNLK